MPYAGQHSDDLPDSGLRIDRVCSDENRILLSATLHDQAYGDIEREPEDRISIAALEELKAEGSFQADVLLGMIACGKAPDPAKTPDGLVVNYDEIAPYMTRAVELGHITYANVIGRSLGLPNDWMKGD